VGYGGVPRGDKGFQPVRRAYKPALRKWRRGTGFSTACSKRRLVGTGKADQDALDLLTRSRKQVAR
jgi:hypothetical protein